MAIQSDPTLVGFNCFASQLEADAYFEGVYFGDSASWLEQADKQESLLVTATRRLNSLTWGGYPLSQSQSLAFPRYFGSSAEYGYSYFPNVAPVPIQGWIPVGSGLSASNPAQAIPKWLKDATCEMALWLWTESDRPATDAEFGMLKSVKLGPVDYAFRDVKAGGNLPNSVAQILRAQGAMIIDLRVGTRSASMVF